MKWLCPSEDLKEGNSRGFQIDESDVLVVRRKGRVYAYKNRCPHRGVRLEWQPDQFLDDSTSLIKCATHAALFLIESGECVAGPCAAPGPRLGVCTRSSRCRSPRSRGPPCA